MAIQFSSREKNKIEKGIRKKYEKVAKNPEGLFKYPTGRAGLEALQYDAELISRLPESVLASFCGVGNPFKFGPVKTAEAVLDIGCGSGVDAIFAAKMAGPGGKVVGIDLMPEMLQRARENLALTHLDNLTFQQASGEDLPFPDESFDVVISNGVFNLIPDKAKALAEVFRVLTSSGRVMIADQVLITEIPKEKKQLIKSWSQ